MTGQAISERGDRMSDVDFEESAEVRKVAERLIDEHHPHLQDAKNLIGYYIRYGTSDWAGKAKKCTAFERHVTGKYMFVFINDDAWRSLHEPQQKALVDHELCHFTRTRTEIIDPETKMWKSDWAEADDPANWSIREHDVEEFSDVIRRHGLWERGIEQFAAAVRQTDYQMTFDDVMNQDKRVVNFGQSVR
jgi:hypothetical protein